MRLNVSGFYDLLMQAPAFIAILKGDQHIFEMANLKYMHLIGSKRKIIGVPVAKAVPESVNQGFVDILDKVYQSGKTFTANEMLVKLDRDETGMLENSYLNFIYQPIKEKDQVIGVFVHGVDVTEEVLSKEKLKQSENNLRILADNISQLVWITDKTGQVSWYNKRWFDYTGVSEVREWEKVLHPNHYDRVIKKFNEAIKLGEAWEDQFPLKDKNGKFHWFLSRAVPIKDEKGEVLYWIGTNTDITEQREREGQLKYQKRLLEAQQEVSPLGVLVISPEGGITTFNQSFVQMWRLPEYITKTGIDYLVLEKGSEMLNEPAQFINTALAAYEKREKRFDRLTFKDGRVIERYGSPVTGDDDFKYGYVWFFQDVTENENLSRQKDDFLRIASHELKTPVTILKGYTQIMHNQAKESDEAEVRMLDRMDKQLDKLTHLISNLLDVTKIETGQLELALNTFNLNSLIYEVAEDFKYNSRKHFIEIELADPVMVKGDYDRIGQVLNNLFTNAIKYSPKSFNIKLNTTLLDKEVQVCIEDGGIGLNTKEQELIFERFYRVKSSNYQIYPGLGLGLFICKEIISRHHGRMWVESEPDKGSRFYFTLPISQQHSGRIPWGGQNL